MLENYYLDLTFTISDAISLIFVAISVHLIWKTNDLQKKQILIQEKQVQMENERLQTHQFEYKHKLSSSLSQAFYCTQRGSMVPDDEIEQINNNANILISFFDEEATEYALQCNKLFIKYNSLRSSMNRYHEHYNVYIPMHDKETALEALKQRGTLSDSILKSIAKTVDELNSTIEEIESLRQSFKTKIANHLKLTN